MRSREKPWVDMGWGNPDVETARIRGSISVSLRFIQSVKHWICFQLFKYTFCFFRFCAVTQAKHSLPAFSLCPV